MIGKHPVHLERPPSGVPQPPSFDSIQFSTIGRMPALFGRLTSPAAEQPHSLISSPGPDDDMYMERSASPTNFSGPSLLQRMNLTSSGLDEVADGDGISPTAMDLDGDGSLYSTAPAAATGSLPGTPASTIVDAAATVAVATSALSLLERLRPEGGPGIPATAINSLTTEDISRRADEFLANTLGSSAIPPRPPLTLSDPPATAGVALLAPPSSDGASMPVTAARVTQQSKSPLSLLIEEEQAAWGEVVETKSKVDLQSEILQWEREWRYRDGGDAQPAPAVQLTAPATSVTTAPSGDAQNHISVPRVPKRRADSIPDVPRRPNPAALSVNTGLAQRGAPPSIPSSKSSGLSATDGKPPSASSSTPKTLSALEHARKAPLTPVLGAASNSGGPSAVSAGSDTAAAEAALRAELKSRLSARRSEDQGSPPGAAPVQAIPPTLATPTIPTAARSTTTGSLASARRRSDVNGISIPLSTVNAPEQPAVHIDASNTLTSARLGRGGGRVVSGGVNLGSLRHPLPPRPGQQRDAGKSGSGSAEQHNITAGAGSAAGGENVPALTSAAMQENVPFTQQFPVMDGKASTVAPTSVEGANAPVGERSLPAPGKRKRGKQPTPTPFKREDSIASSRASDSLAVDADEHHPVKKLKEGSMEIKIKREDSVPPLLLRLSGPPLGAAPADWEEPSPMMGVLSSLSVEDDAPSGQVVSAVEQSALDSIPPFCAHGGQTDGPTSREMSPHNSLGLSGPTAISNAVQAAYDSRVRDRDRSRVSGTDRSASSASSPRASQNNRSRASRSANGRMRGSGSLPLVDHWSPGHLVDHWSPGRDDAAEFRAYDRRSSGSGRSHPNYDGRSRGSLTDSPAGSRGRGRPLLRHSDDSPPLPMRGRGRSSPPARTSWTADQWVPDPSPPRGGPRPPRQRPAQPYSRSRTPPRRGKKAGSPVHFRGLPTSPGTQHRVIYERAPEPDSRPLGPLFREHMPHADYPTYRDYDDDYHPGPSNEASGWPGRWHPPSQHRPAPNDHYDSPRSDPPHLYRQRRQFDDHSPRYFPQNTQRDERYDDRTERGAPPSPRRLNADPQHFMSLEHDRLQRRPLPLHPYPHNAHDEQVQLDAPFAQRSPFRPVESPEPMQPDEDNAVDEHAVDDAGVDLSMRSTGTSSIGELLYPNSETPPSSPPPAEEGEVEVIASPESPPIAVPSAPAPSVQPAASDTKRQKHNKRASPSLLNRMETAGASSEENPLLSRIELGTSQPKDANTRPHTNAKRGANRNHNRQPTSYGSTNGNADGYFESAVDSQHGTNPMLGNWQIEPNRIPLSSRIDLNSVLPSRPSGNHYNHQRQHSNTGPQRRQNTEGQGRAPNDAPYRRPNNPQHNPNRGPAPSILNRLSDAPAPYQGRPADKLEGRIS